MNTDGIPPSIINEIKQKNKWSLEPIVKNNNKQVAVAFPAALFNEALKLVADTKEDIKFKESDGLIATSINLPEAIIFILDTLKQQKLRMNRAEGIRADVRSLIFSPTYTPLRIAEMKIFNTMSELVRYAIEQSILLYDKAFFTKMRLLTGGK